MSASSAEAAPPGGVVHSSALSFVAPAQPNAPPADHGQGSGAVPTEMGQAEVREPCMPAGVRAVCAACSALYPAQPNPLQVTTRLKYWLGGSDPLDYISMYWSPGKPEEHVPPHWHYVSFGLSDLHGDGRVHPRPVSPAAPSGYGFELTFRLAAEQPAAGGEVSGDRPPPPPLWPAALMQALARYVFTTGNKLSAGDHITWHRPLDAARSRLRHLLLAADALLPETRSAHGTVAFLQLVGCTGRELRAAQRGSGFEVLSRLAGDPRCGGSWLVTRARRRRSARSVTPRPGPRGAPPAPAQLAGVCATVHWCTWTPGVEEQGGGGAGGGWQQRVKDTLQRGLSSMGADHAGVQGHMSTDSFEMSSMERALPSLSHEWSREPPPVCYPPGVHIVLNAEAASLLPLALHGRVLAGSEFTWRGAAHAVTLAPAPDRNPGPSRPYTATGHWLQAVLPHELAVDMSVRVRALARLVDSESTDSDRSVDSDHSVDSVGPESTDPLTLPLTLAWPEHSLKITVARDTDFL